MEHDLLMSDNDQTYNEDGWETSTDHVSQKFDESYDDIPNVEIEQMFAGPLHPPTDVLTLLYPVRNAPYFHYIAGADGEFTGRCTIPGSGIIYERDSRPDITSLPHIQPAPHTNPNKVPLLIPGGTRALEYDTTFNDPRACHPSGNVQLRQHRNSRGSKWPSRKSLQGKGKHWSRKQRDKSVDHACFRCTFLGKACKYVHGRDACMNCTRKWASESETIIPNPQQMPLSIKAVYWFEIKETLTALSELRSEISGVLGPRESEIFQHFCQKPILCNMSCDASPTPFSNRLQPVVVSPHSIISEAATEEHIPHPALNTEQMNRFVDRQIMDLLGEDLYGLSTNIITAALRCGVWLAILFNFHGNAVSQGHGIQDFMAKSLIIETMYSMVYEIRQNVKVLFDEVVTSFTSAPDPEAVACALGVLYRSVHTRHFPSSSTTLKSLDKFLNGFRERSEHALQNLKRTRKLFSTYNCKSGTRYIQLRKVLIEIQSGLDPVMQLEFEESHLQGPLGMERKDRSILNRMSQMQILEAPVLLLQYFDLSSSGSGSQDFPKTPESASRLSAENLRCLSNSTPTIDEAEERSSQCATTENMSTRSEGTAMPDCAGDFLSLSEFGAKDCEKIDFREMFPTLLTTKTQLDDWYKDGDYSIYVSHENLPMDLDYLLKDGGEVADLEV